MYIVDHAQAITHTAVHFLHIAIYSIVCLNLTCICVGSGGNNHAVDYYNETKYPLAVKLGTITPDGADIYSYDEDNMVEDTLLSQHLAHFGIDITSMTKVGLPLMMVLFNSLLYNIQ